MRRLTAAPGAAPTKHELLELKKIIESLLAPVVFGCRSPQLCSCFLAAPRSDRTITELPSPLRPAFKEPPPAGWKDATPHDEIGKGNWWEVFGDPQLNDLETQALMANQTLQAAVQNVLQSRASLAVTRSQQYPQIGAQPSLSGGRLAGTRAAPRQCGAALYGLPAHVAS